ncbi:amino acid permease [Brevibacillus reuszeri]|uniref:Amino acid permease n=3 Tax=Brevibacillus reuszeri TaxID=54915 RepID=A0A0K9YQV8_9BACL|nr:amino acid permease [Brevibacillus reuszeri]KNB70565.1 amino acid permease [Brevibacillus reuszeri]MED1861465.1 amino acid permease [Brevibacillus reuszeri]GED70011.1 amino acid permease [Brevibacillus reuszeri]
MMEQRVLELAPERKLGYWHIWALGVGAVVGDGVFLLMGQGIAMAGPGAILAYFIAGLSQFFLMIALGELAVGMPNAGAMSRWVERMMGRWWGFLSGVTFALGWVIAGGSVGLALGKITMWFFPQLQGEYWSVIFAVFFITVFAVLNILGTEIAATTQLLLVIIMTAVIAIFSLIGLKDMNLENFTPFLPHGSEGFWSAIPLGTYAYLGAVTLATAGGECKDPKDLPKALIWSGITFLILYTAAQAVLQGLIPWNQITMDSSPFTVAAGQVFGFAGAFVMNAVAWIAAATCILMGTLYAASRIFYAQAREGFLPAFFGYLHPKTKTPLYGILFVWACSVALVILGSLNPDFLYVELSNQLVLSWMVSWTLALIAAVLYRKKHPDEIERLPWKQPLYPLFPILGFIGIGIVCYGSFVGSPMTLLRGAIWMGALFIVFKLFQKKGQSTVTHRS